MDPRALICELCRQFYAQGWVSGTGGGISIRHEGKVYMAPSGVQKERLQPEDLYELDDAGNVLSAPDGEVCLSACAPLFFNAFRLRDAGAVLHSHSINAMLATLSGESVAERRASGAEGGASRLAVAGGDENRGQPREQKTQSVKSELRITHLEMMKGIRDHGYHDELVVPIIRNTAHEHDLADSMAAAIEAYPKTQAVLVERHGVYVWGRDWQEAKKHAECYDYLFEAAVKMRQLGIDPARAPGEKR